MSPDSVRVPPFRQEYRASGLLLHVTSLPSPYGIGDLGVAAIRWVDRLADAGQSWWQMLPLGPTGFGNSPYQALSSFAGNELLISPDWLIEDDLLRATDVESHSFPQDNVDYNAVTTFKLRLILKAWTNFNAGARIDLQPAYEQFRNDQKHWLEDYSTFRALKIKFGGANYLEWPVELIERQPAALERVRGELASEIDQVCFAQYVSFRQADRLKAYAHRKGIGLIGDLPFFVSPDSSDVWAHPEFFLLDEKLRPRVVAGVPPDYFSATGQLWGNPIYDWEALRQSDYRWAIRRLRALLAHVDVIRVDHFRALVAAWHVLAGAATAQLGKWIAGPGADLLHAIQRELGALPFIAEDLGMITPDVNALRDQFELPGMRVLQFAFDGHSDNPYLPENYEQNTIVYTGTHDNPTTRGWFEDLPDTDRRRVRNYLKFPGMKSDKAAAALMELAWSSCAGLSMAPLQDLLNLGSEARMNVPGRPEGNWTWRSTEEMLSDWAFEWLREMIKNSNRTGATPSLTEPTGVKTPENAGAVYRACPP